MYYTVHDIATELCNSLLINSNKPKLQLQKNILCFISSKQIITFLNNRLMFQSTTNSICLAQENFLEIQAMYCKCSKTVPSKLSTV